MTKTITFEWIIYDSRKGLGCGFSTGTSTLEVTAKNYAEVMNHVISFCESVPSWEFKRNNIDLEQYREDAKSCRYFYHTQLLSIISIK